MNILLLGPQGSGKGTQGRLLAEKFGFLYLSAGDILREAAKTNKEVKDLLSTGAFFPDEVTFGFVTKYLEEKKTFDNLILDGFPRGIKQYQMMKDWLAKKGTKIDICLNLEISEEETIRRLSARRQDPETGKIYNLISDPPPAGVDQSKLVQRSDDKPEAIKKRLGWSKTIVEPLIELLRKEIKVFDIDGERAIDQIQSGLVKVVEKENHGMANG